MEYEKIKEAEIVKIGKVGSSIEGKFVSISVSSKYDDGYALKFDDKISFVNRQAYELFINSTMTKGQNFKLVFKEERKTTDKKMTYRFFELYVEK
jgi:hypothetical protein